MKTFEQTLLETKSYPPERKPPPDNKLYVRFRPNFEAFMKNHSGQTFFLTFGLGKQHEISVAHEWQKCETLY